MRDRQKSLSSKGLKQYWLTNPSQNTVHGAQSGTRQNCAFSVRTIHAPIPLSTPPEKSWWTEITTQRSPSYAIAARYPVSFHDKQKKQSGYFSESGFNPHHRWS
ncbi:TPA: hypothetical protein ACJI3M_002769 [Citrobacter freundii]